MLLVPGFSTSRMSGKSGPLQRFPDKNPNGSTLPGDPAAFFPLTNENMRQNLPLMLRQFLTFDLRHLEGLKAVCEHLYTPDARFHYPLAECNGRDAITAFWRVFLLGRALQLNNVHSVHVDVTWDEESLKAFVQMEAWQHIVPLAWLDRLLNVPAWKVWTTQVMQFAPSPYPSDGPGALRITFQEELQDQFVFFGLVPLGIYSIRTDPGTALNAISSLFRKLNGLAVQLWAGVLVVLLQAVGFRFVPCNE